MWQNPFIQLNLCPLFKYTIMIKVTLPDGSSRDYESGSSAMDVAKSISHGLARNVLSASFNGDTVEPTQPLTTDGNLVLYTWDNAEGKEAFWHSSAHVLAQTILQFHPDAILTIGPAIENGFYYDVDFGEANISEKEFAQIEKKFIENARQKHEFNMRMVSKADALEHYKDSPFETELLENL